MFRKYSSNASSLKDFATVQVNPVDFLGFWRSVGGVLTRFGFRVEVLFV